MEPTMFITGRMDEIFYDGVSYRRVLAHTPLWFRISDNGEPEPIEHTEEIYRRLESVYRSTARIV